MVGDWIAIVGNISVWRLGYTSSMASANSSGCSSTVGADDENVGAVSLSGSRLLFNVLRCGIFVAQYLGV